MIQIDPYFIGYEKHPTHTKRERRNIWKIILCIFTSHKVMVALKGDRWG